MVCLYVLRLAVKTQLGIPTRPRLAAGSMAASEGKEPLKVKQNTTLARVSEVWMLECWMYTPQSFGVMMQRVLIL